MLGGLKNFRQNQQKQKVDFGQSGDIRRENGEKPD